MSGPHHLREKLYKKFVDNEVGELLAEYKLIAEP